MNLIPISEQRNEQLLSRKEIASRWNVSTATVKRRSRDGGLPTVKFNQRLVRYRLSDVLRIEDEAITRTNHSPENHADQQEVRRH
jgi:hypothetical protein